MPSKSSTKYPYHAPKELTAKPRNMHIEHPSGDPTGTTSAIMFKPQIGYPIGAYSKIPTELPIVDHINDTSDDPTHVPSTVPSRAPKDAHIGAPTDTTSKFPSRDTIPKTISDPDALKRGSQRSNTGILSSDGTT